MQYRIVEADPNVLLPHGADELVPARSQAIHIEQHRVEVTRMSRAGREVAVSEGGDKSVQSRQEPIVKAAEFLPMSEPYLDLGDLVKPKRGREVRHCSLMTKDGHVI